MVISAEQQRGSATHIHVSILPQSPLASRLADNIEQSSLCCTAGHCWLSVLNIAVCTCWSWFLVFLFHSLEAFGLFPFPLRNFELSQRCIWLGSFSFTILVLFRALQSESSCASILYYFLDNFSPYYFLIPLFWNSSWLDKSPRLIFFFFHN